MTYFFTEFFRFFYSLINLPISSLVKLTLRNCLKCVLLSSGILIIITCIFSSYFLLSTSFLSFSGLMITIHFPSLPDHCELWHILHYPKYFTSTSTVHLFAVIPVLPTLLSCLRFFLLLLSLLSHCLSFYFPHTSILFFFIFPFFFFFFVFLHLLPSSSSFSFCSFFFL